MIHAPIKASLSVLPSLVVVIAGSRPSELGGELHSRIETEVASKSRSLRLVASVRGAVVFTCLLLSVSGLCAVVNYHYLVGYRGFNSRDQRPGVHCIILTLQWMCLCQGSFSARGAVESPSKKGRHFIEVP